MPEESRTCGCSQIVVINAHQARRVAHLKPLKTVGKDTREYVCPMTLVHWIRRDDEGPLERWTPGPLFSIG